MDLSCEDPYLGVIYAGFIEKSNPKRHQWKQSFKRRYFVLTKDFLYWFQREEYSNEFVGEERGRVPLAQIASVEICDSEEDGVFELNSSGSERRVMKCPSKIVCKEWVDAIQNAVQMKRNPNREIIQSRTTSLLQLGRSSLLSRIGRANSNDICSSPGRDQDIIHRKDKDIIPTATTITTPTPFPPSSCLIFASLRSKRRSAEVLISRRLNWEKWVLVTEVVIDDELVLTTGLGHCVVLLQSQMETHSRDGHIFIVDTDTDTDRGSGNSDSNNDTDHVHELVSDEHTDTEKKQHHHLPRPLGPRMQLQIQVRRNGSGNRRSLELSLASHSNTHTHTSQQQLVTVMLSTAVGLTVVFLTATEGWHPWRRLGSAVSMILSLALALLSVIQFVTKYRQRQSQPINNTQTDNPTSTYMTYSYSFRCRIASPPPHDEGPGPLTEPATAIPGDSNLEQKQDKETTGEEEEEGENTDNNLNIRNIDMNTNNNNNNNNNNADIDIDIDNETMPTRFLVGCDYDMKEAQRRWDITKAWREKENINDILKEPQPFFNIIKSQLAQLRTSGVSPSIMLRHWVFVTEYQWRFTSPEPDAQSIAVIDLEGVTFAMLAGSDAVETLRSTIVKHLVDEKTQKKIHILSKKEVLPGLLEHISMEEIPIYYGGKKSFGPDIDSCRFSCPEELGLDAYVQSLNNSADSGKHKTPILSTPTRAPTSTASVLTSVRGGGSVSRSDRSSVT
eukprot:gene3582-7121_t